MNVVFKFEYVLLCGKVGKSDRLDWFLLVGIWQGDHFHENDHTGRAVQFLFSKAASKIETSIAQLP